MFALYVPNTVIYINHIAILLLLLFLSTLHVQHLLHVCPSCVWEDAVAAVGHILYTGGLPFCYVRGLWFNCSKHCSKLWFHVSFLPKTMTSKASSNNYKPTELCFCPPDVFGFCQLLREISGSSAATCSTMFTCCLLTFLCAIWCWAAVRWVYVSFFPQRIAVCCLWKWH